MTGAALTLLTMITSLPSPASGGSHHNRLPLPLLAYVGSDQTSAPLPPTLPWRVHHPGIPARDRTRALLANGLDTTACSASVARGRVKRLGFKLAGADPTLSRSSRGSVPRGVAASGCTACRRTARVAGYRKVPRLSMFVGADLTHATSGGCRADLATADDPEPTTWRGKGLTTFYTPPWSRLQASCPQRCARCWHLMTWQGRQWSCTQDCQPDQALRITTRESLIAAWQPRVACRHPRRLGRWHRATALIPHDDAAPCDTQ